MSKTFQPEEEGYSQVEYPFCPECGMPVDLPPLPPTNALVEAECDFYLCQARIAFKLIWVNENGLDRGYIYPNHTLSGGISEG